MSSRCSPILNPNSSSTINKDPNAISSSSNIRYELSKILLQHDPNAIRLYDFINHVTIYFYNSNEHHWETNSSIEGNLFLYERKFIKDNQKYPSYAFAIINGTEKFIQEIHSNMLQNSDKLSLFYEVVTDNKCDVYWLRFVNENECQRLTVFITKAIGSLKNFEQQNSRNIIENPNQNPRTNISQQETSREVKNVNKTQVNNFSKQESTPVSNSNTNSGDPSLSLKRLLNIQKVNDSDDELMVAQSKNTLDLIPPSAFESTPSTNIVHHALPLSRDQFRNVLLDLVQNNDHFLNIIHRGCQNHLMQ